MIVFDGRTYDKFSEVPNLGSFKPLGTVGSTHYYSGLSADVEKLPTSVGNGSLALCIDIGCAYMFEETSKKWYKQPEGSVDISVVEGKLVINT